MARRQKKFGLAEVAGYLLGGAVLLLAAMTAAGPGSLYLPIGLAAAGILIVLGSITFLGNRRILPVSVTRDGDSIVCRYIPWYELNSYTIFVLTPLIGLAALAAGSAPGRPGWLRLAGLAILGLVGVTGYFVVRMWRRCLLTFSPSAVTVRLPAPGSELTEIARSRIRSITAGDAEVGAGFAPMTVTQVGVDYQPADRDTGTATVLLGPPPGKTALQVSVAPADLYNALLVWKDADPHDARLMDRIEAILRGRSPTDS